MKHPFHFRPKDHACPKCGERDCFGIFKTARPHLTVAPAAAHQAAPPARYAQVSGQRPQPMTARLMAQQEVEREARNRAGLLRWHVRTFGPVAGALLAADPDGYRAFMTDMLTGTAAVMVPSDGTPPYRVDPTEIRL